MNCKEAADSNSNESSTERLLDADIEFVLDSGGVKSPRLGEVVEEGGIFQNQGELPARPKFIPSLKNIYQSLMAQEVDARRQRIRAIAFRLVCLLLLAGTAALVTRLSTYAMHRYAFANNPAHFVERKQNILGGVAVLQQRAQKYPYGNDMTLVDPVWRLEITGETDETIEVQLLDDKGHNVAGGVWEFTGDRRELLKPFRYYTDAEHWLFSFKGGLKQQLVRVVHPWDRQRRSQK